MSGTVKSPNYHSDTQNTKCIRQVKYLTNAPRDLNRINRDHSEHASTANKRVFDGYSLQCFEEGRLCEYGQEGFGSLETWRILLDRDWCWKSRRDSMAFCRGAICLRARFLVNNLGILGSVGLFGVLLRGSTWCLGLGVVGAIHMLCLGDLRRVYALLQSTTARSCHESQG